LQLLRHRSDMQHARPNDGAGRGEGHGFTYAFEDAPRAGTDTGEEMHGGPEQLEQRWRLGSTYGNRYGAKDNGFSQGGRAILDMDPCQCPTTPVFGMISRRGIR
jgi:hypothetical protein